MEYREVEAGKLAGVLKGHKYDELARTLEVRFRDGRVWVHANVPRALYEQMCQSQQPAAFWAISIRQAADDNNRKLYPVVKVRNAG